MLILVSVKESALEGSRFILEVVINQLGNFI